MNIVVFLYFILLFEIIIKNLTRNRPASSFHSNQAAPLQSGTPRPDF